MTPRIVSQQQADSIAKLNAEIRRARIIRTAMMGATCDLVPVYVRDERSYADGRPLAAPYPWQAEALLAIEGPPEGG